MRRLLGLVVVAACGAKAPPAVDNASTKPDVSESAPIQSFIATDAPRPDIDISALRPDFHEELRWPLGAMNHPSLEPRFAVAEQLAAPGIDWEELCQRGVHRRVVASQREMLTYLHAWCDVQARDIDAACRRLAPLIGSTTRGLTAAARQDLANILVATGDADKAEHCLSKHNIRDIDTIDLLAASYVEVGSDADAFAINRRAIDSDDHASVATKCLRLVREIVLAREADPRLAFEAMEALATKPKVPDPTCVRLYDKVKCHRDHRQCRTFYTDEPIGLSGELLVEAYYEWPANASRYTTWLKYVDRAKTAIPEDGATELVVAALEAAARSVTSCPRDLAVGTAGAIERIYLYVTHAGYETRLHNLQANCDLSIAPPP